MTDSLVAIWCEHAVLQALRERRSIPTKTGAGLPRLGVDDLLQRQLPDLAHKLIGVGVLTASKALAGKCPHKNLCLGACVATLHHGWGSLNASGPFCDRAVTVGLPPSSGTKAVS
jgi:hypothetical protein